MLIPLAPIDYNFAFKPVPPIQFLLEFEDRLDERRLRASLDDVLAEFPLLLGRLEPVGKFELAIRVPSSRGGGIPMRLERIDGEVDLKNVEQSFGLVDEVVPRVGEPLLKISLTHAGERSYLGISMSHAAGDGYSFFCFVDAWAKAFAGDAFTSPAMDRTVLRRGLPGPGGEITADRVLRDTGYGWSSRPYPGPGVLCREVVKFTPSEVAGMRADARAGGFSLNDAITARVLKRFFRYAPRRDPEVITVRCPVDYRRLHPDLSMSYFGNVLRDAVVEFDAGSFCDTGLDEIARRVRAVIRDADADTVIRCLGCFEDLRLQHGPGGFQLLYAPGLIVTNFSRTRAKDVSFGGMAPRSVLNLSRSPRTANVVPQRDHLEVQLLRPECPLY